MLSLLGSKYNPNSTEPCRDYRSAHRANRAAHNLNKLKRPFKKCLRTKVQVLS